MNEKSMNTIYFRFKNQLITAFFCILIAITTTCLMSKDKAEFALPAFQPLTKECKVVIVIPAYNEQERIEKTLLAYLKYFKNLKKVTATFLVVCNNCSDKTVEICKKIKKKYPQLDYIDLKPGGKGFAIKQGFLKALDYKDIDFIGFVDADMATTPPYFYELITAIKNNDGAIASRYKKGARVWPNRPFVKKIGGKFYNWVLRNNFHFDIRDTQCGAKLFTYKTVQTIAKHMKETGWAFDLELLYLCQLFDKKIIEIPTTWTDVAGSHLTISGSYKEFITAPIRIKKEHTKLAQKLSKKNSDAKKAARKKVRLEKKGHHRPPTFMAEK